MKHHILVIDDDVSLRRVLEYNLENDGYLVQTASSGEEGLELFQQHKPSLVITDMKMTGMTGLTVLTSIKERSPETLVIILTAFGTVDLAVEAMKAGAHDYLTKPFNRDELRLTVKKALEFKGLTEENRRLKVELSDRSELRTMVGASQQMEKVFGVVRKVADTEAPVLIMGESGTGKELIARSLHANSSRREGPFVAINCAAIPRDLLESELFGHVKGAFTGAVRDKTGKFQLADGGTLFLDEVGELPVELQPKLLRALQEREVEPVGGTCSYKLDVRIVSATNVNIEKAIEQGSFREDIYYRLSVIPIQLPPLRERSGDIPLLIRYFCSKHGGEQVTFEKGALEALVNYPWPGNVRELENTVERLLIMREADQVRLDELPGKFRENRVNAASVLRLPEGGYSLEQLEREAVVESLERNAWNQAAAARFLRIPRHTLMYRMEKYQITLPAGARRGAAAESQTLSS